MNRITLSARAGGLFFSAEALRHARENRADATIAAAAARLHSDSDDPLERAYLAALRYQFAGDAAGGQSALSALRDSELFAASGSDARAIKRALGWCATAALLREHPAAGAHQGAINSALREAAQRFKAAREKDDVLRRFWLAAYEMAAGILLDDDGLRQGAAAAYRHAVERQIHPEGYLKGIADEEAPGASYERQLSGTGALIALAEMSGRAGLDLWAYTSRGVSPITAAAYTYFYYFFPEKWRWEPQLSRERALASMRAEGAFMEIVNQRHRLHGIEQLFDEQRPFFCPWCGGLTSLTHSLKRGRERRRWRFW